MAIATATAFVLVAAAIGLVLDRPAARDLGGGWRLRGSLDPLVVAASRQSWA